MKLSDWAKKQGLSYLTAYRWFKDGNLPIPAYQSESGTIIVREEPENVEQSMAVHSNDIMSLFLKKTVEFSKNNSTIEDFAAYILSNFQLKLNTHIELPKYSKNKPKAEDVQKHFKQFIKPKGEKPKPNMFVTAPEVFDELAAQADLLTTSELENEIKQIQNVDLSENSLNNLFTSNVNYSNQPEVKDLIKDLSTVFSTNYISSPTSSLFNRVADDSIFDNTESSVDSFNLQQTINCTDSTNTNSINSVFSLSDSPVTSATLSTGGTFKPTQKEIESIGKAMTQVADKLHTEVKSKRGRKPFKHLGNK